MSGSCGAFPDHGLVGEEYGTEAGDASVRWYIDPIDGTHNFIRGVPLFGTLLAVERDGELQAAVLSAPALDERWWALAGWRSVGAQPRARRRGGSTSRASRPGRRPGPVRLGPRHRGVGSGARLRRAPRRGLARARLRRLLGLRAGRRGRGRGDGRGRAVGLGRGRADARSSRRPAAGPPTSTVAGRSTAGRSSRPTGSSTSACGGGSWKASRVVLTPDVSQQTTTLSAVAVVHTPDSPGSIELRAMGRWLDRGSRRRTLLAAAISPLSRRRDVEAAAMAAWSHVGWSFAGPSTSSDQFATRDSAPHRSRPWPLQEPSRQGHARHTLPRSRPPDRALPATETSALASAHTSGKAGLARHWCSLLAVPMCSGPARAIRNESSWPISRPGSRQCGPVSPEESSLPSSAWKSVRTYHPGGTRSSRARRLPMRLVSDAGVVHASRLRRRGRPRRTG